jgi:hypothetical protein
VEDRCVLVIGVSGHRFLADEEKIQQGVEIALQKIKHNFPNHELICHTSLAEGADRLVAKMILERHRGKIWVALPFNTEEYCKDFQSIQSQQDFHALMGQAEKIEIMPVTATRELAYLAAGKYVLDHGDVLLVIWDGKKPQGQGGTGEIVLMARKNKQPIAWVHAGNRKTGTQQATSLGEEQGKLTLENFQRTGMGR